MVHRIAGADLVALSRAATTTTLAWTLVTTGGAVARDMAGLAAAVAGLGVLGTLGAVTAHVALNCKAQTSLISLLSISSEVRLQGNLLPQL